MKWKVPFNRPYFTEKELKYIKKAAVKFQTLGNDGFYTKKSEAFLKTLTETKGVFLTNSATAALEMAAFLLDIKEGDEIIMPSFAYISTANVFLIKGAKLVFVDINKETFNIDERLIEEKITDRTKAIFPIHYGGNSCALDKIKKIAKKHNIPIIEDAAQGIDSYYKNKHLGTIGNLGIISFHETKNIHCGNGGALLINKKNYLGAAEILIERGTDKHKFLRGEISYYSWIEKAGSYGLSELNAAFLYAQLQDVKKVTSKHRDIYLYYLNNFKDLEEKGYIVLPKTEKNIIPNYHIFPILLENRVERDKFIDYMKENSIETVFHYFPLHLSKMGKKLGYKKGDLPVTEDIAARLVRLPLFYDFTVRQQDLVIKKTKEFFMKKNLNNGKSIV